MYNSQLHSDIYVASLLHKGHIYLPYSLEGEQILVSYIMTMIHMFPKQDNVNKWKNVVTIYDTSDKVYELHFLSH